MDQGADDWVDDDTPTQTVDIVFDGADLRGTDFQKVIIKRVS